MADTYTHEGSSDLNTEVLERRLLGKESRWCLDGCVCSHLLPPHPTCTRAFLIPRLTTERCRVARCSIFSDPEVALP